MKNIDSRFITSDFLMKYFPSPNRFHELSSKPPESTLAASEELYLAYKDSVNQQLQRNGKDQLSDYAISLIFTNAQGIVSLPRPHA